MAELTPTQMMEAYERQLRAWGKHPEQIAARKAKARTKRKAARHARRSNRP